MFSAKTVPLEEEKFHIQAETMNYDDRVKVLNHGDSFAIFDRWGDIHPHSKKAQGIFHRGTRFLDRLELKLNNKKPLLLSSSIKEDNDMLSVDLTNAHLPQCKVLENTLHLARGQFIRNGVYYEAITLTNFSGVRCEFELSLAFGADFRDLFEIRGIQRNREAQKPEMRSQGNRLWFDYEGLDEIRRRTEIIFPETEGLTIRNNTVVFNIGLSPHQRQKFTYHVVFYSDEDFITVHDHKEHVADFTHALELMRTELDQIHGLFASITTSNEQFTHWINRSRADLVSLLTPTDFGLYPYAGVPWYNTAFGRDGIITAMETLWLAPDVARDTLLVLAQMQATENIPEKDAEPGKILHEARCGEMANTGEIPFKQYYGTIDATPLFIMLAGMYYRQTADMDTIRRIWPNIGGALDWIDQYGDIDGDGFVEYQHKAENGLTNQGWKDSNDSVMYASGDLCEPPIALCEVQGYVYAAKQNASFLASALDEEELSEKLRSEAEALKKKFNEVFWDEPSGCFALALDRQKNRCNVVSSNAGHCLFTGIVDERYAARLVETLTTNEMLSGWGIRTLSMREKRYNPISYHNGSVWPHDNALIAAGFARYGFQKEALRIMGALFDASLFIDLQRMPELYCGFEKRPGEGPTSYPVACSPQAWSVGAVFLLIQACLQLEIDAVSKTITFQKPAMPDFIYRLTIANLRLGDSSCDIDLHRYEHDIGFHVTRKPADWTLIIKK